MNLIGLLVLCFFSAVYGGWVQDLRSPSGAELGYGFSLHLDDIESKGSHGRSLRLAYGGYGVSVGKSAKKEAYEIGFHMSRDGQEEGRGKDKMGEILLPAFLGFKVAGVTTVVFAAIGTLVLKALGIAKLALVLSSLLLIPKLLGGHESYPPKHIQFEAHSSEQHPVFAEYPEGGFVHMTAADATPYLSYANYVPTGHEGVAESAANYAIVEAPNSNLTVAGIAHPAAVLKRRDSVRRKAQVPTPVVTVRKYTVQTK